MAEGKNGGYIWWAKKYHVKQFAESILFLQQHNIRDRATLNRILLEKKEAYSKYKKMKREMRDYQIAKQNVDTFYANEKNIRAEEELKKKRQTQR